MRAVVQRISQGEVRVDGQSVGSAGKGLMVLVGFNHEDVTSAAGREYILDKILHLRIFEDEQGKMNLWKEPIPEEWWPDLSMPYEERYPSRFLGE